MINEAEMTTRQNRAAANNVPIVIIFEIYNSVIMIKETNNSLLNIAFKSGFYSIEYFSEMFKKIIDARLSTCLKFYIAKIYKKS